MLLKILCKYQENTSDSAPFLIRIGWTCGPATIFIKKEALTQVFSREYWETLCKIAANCLFFYYEASSKSKKVLCLGLNKQNLSVYFGTLMIQVKLMVVSIISCVSLWYRPCYKNMLNHDNHNKYQKFTRI